MEEAVFVQDRLNDAKPGRVYYGEEACERRIPTAKMYLEGVRELQEAGRTVTIVFPPVTDKGMTKIGAVLKALKDVKDLECVVNDYGLLDFANKNGPPMKFIIGRLLARVLTQNILDLHAYDQRECEKFCDSLRSKNVGRLEFDRFNLGLMKSSLEDIPFPLTMFTPFDIMSFTRRCTIAGCSTSDDNPFTACKQECRDVSFDVSHKYLEGQFFIYENLVLKYAETPGRLHKRFDRMVRWHPPQLRIAGQSG